MPQQMNKSLTEIVFSCPTNTSSTDEVITDWDYKLKDYI